MNDPGADPRRSADSASPSDTDYWSHGLQPGEEPVVTGTLFAVIVILMIIAAIWIIMYLRLLER